MNNPLRAMRIVLFGAAIASLNVLAQSPEEMATRRNLLGKARKAHLAGNHGQALLLAERAGEIHMTPSVRQFIAEEQREVGKLADSMNNAELCFIEATKDKALANRRIILDRCNYLLTDQQESVARVVISLPDPAPPGVQVMVGGQRVPEAFYGLKYYVNPGRASIEATAPGYRPFWREQVLLPGEEMAVTVSLPQESATVPPLSQQIPQTAAPLTGTPTVVSGGHEKGPPGIGPYIVLGAGAASLAASGLFLILRNDQTKKLEAQCSATDRTLCPDQPEARSLRNQASNYNRLANITLGVAGAALVGGAAWFLFERMGSSGSPARAQLHVVPVQGGATLVLTGAL